MRSQVDDAHAAQPQIGPAAARLAELSLTAVDATAARRWVSREFAFYRDQHNDEMELEVIGFDLASCLVAQEHGADRIELCANPHEGGTTPSYGMIAIARRYTTIQLFPIIRPRGGDFLYTQMEFAAMIADVEQCGLLGCDGVVIGMLTEDGKVDTDRCAELIDRAGPMQVTFHRAFDRVQDPMRSLEDVIALGCTRILTCGLHPNVDLGKHSLRALVDAAAQRIVIMPGADVRSTNILDLAKITGAKAFHSSARSTHASKMEYTNPAMGEVLDSIGIDAIEVQALRRNLDRYANERSAVRFAHVDGQRLPEEPGDPQQHSDSDGEPDDAVPGRVG